MNRQRNVAILLFDEVEVLDFAGPFEVFSVAGRRREIPPFNVYTVAETHGPVAARGGLGVNARYAIMACPQPDVLVVPGGWGTRALLSDETVLDWIRSTAAAAERVVSVCTGSLLLAKAGLLEGLEATTHHEAFDRLAEVGPNTRVVRDRRVVDAGKIVTSGGISAGIDMAFHVVESLVGREEAAEAARYMEYRWP